jgi:hypothetical protein
MRIKVLEVGNVTKEKTYFVYPLKFESNGKTQERKMFSFNTESYKALKDAKPDQVYEVKLEKDQNGYWQWSNVEEATGQAAAQSTGTNRASTFETPEERARRQVLIVRQNALTNAVTVVAPRADLAVNLEEIEEIARKFEAWVLRD